MKKKLRKKSKIGWIWKDWTLKWHDRIGELSYSIIKKQKTKSQEVKIKITIEEL